MKSKAVGGLIGMSSNAVAMATGPDWKSVVCTVGSMPNPRPNPKTYIPTYIHTHIDSYIQTYIHTTVPKVRRHQINA